MNSSEAEILKNALDLVQKLLCPPKSKEMTEEKDPDGDDDDIKVMDQQPPKGGVLGAEEVAMTANNASIKISNPIVDKEAIIALLDEDEDVQEEESRVDEVVESIPPPADRPEKSDKVEENTRWRSRNPEVEDRLKFHCVICDKAFAKRSQLQLHRIKEHKTPVARCTVCNTVFATAAKLKRHLPKHKGHECSLCSNKYVSRMELQTHMALDHVTIVACSMCGDSFRHKQLLRKHMRVHTHPSERISCPFDDCPRSYTLKRNLNQHIRSFHEGKRFPCSVQGCTFVLSTKQKLSHHKRLHSLNRVVPTFARRPRDDWDIKRRKLRVAEEKRLREEAKRNSAPWWERSTTEDDTDVRASDCSLSRFLQEEPEVTAKTSSKSAKKSKRRRRRRRRKDSSMMSVSDAEPELSATR